MGLENILLNIDKDDVGNSYIRNKINLLFKDIDRIQNIIEHVRVFSRDQENSIIENVSINDVINNALSLVSRQLTDRNIELTVTAPEYQIEISGNQYRLEQVLLNIISNAKFAVDEKEKRLGNQGYHKRLTIDLNKSDKEAIITIVDNGVGIHADIISRIFDPFFTTKSEDKGTGLGLSISYGIIREMNGSINVESELGKFTRIIVKLPII